MVDEREQPMGEPSKDPSSDPDWKADPFWDPQWTPEEPPSGGFVAGLGFLILWLTGALGWAAALFLTILLVLVWIASTALVVTTLLSPGRGMANFEAVAVVTLLSWLLVYWRFRRKGPRSGRHDLDSD